MEKAFIELSDQESRALRELMEQTGKSQQQLLHEAVTRLLTQTPSAERLTCLRQARGIWKDRTDLPSLRSLREEWERSHRKE